MQRATAPPTPSAPSIARTMTARFAPVDIGADIAALPDNERQALAQLVEAARIMDGLFLRQVWAGNDAHAARRSRAQAVTAARRAGRRACTTS